MVFFIDPYLTCECRTFSLFILDMYIEAIEGNLCFSERFEEYTVIYDRIQKWSHQIIPYQ